MKETNCQFSLSSSDEKTYIGNREILGRDARVQKDDAPIGKYTNLGIDENTSYSSWAAEAAADSYIASKSNNNQRKHKSDHTALLTVAIIVVFVCILVFGGIYADGGFDALLTDDATTSSESGDTLQYFNYDEWKGRQIAEANGETYTPMSPAEQYLADHAPKPEEEPASGTILLGSRITDGSELTISTSNHPCVVKLKDYAGVTKLSFYVRKNTKITMTVPSEYMYVYFASGETWYGYNHLFGEDTSYSKDDDLLDFNNYTFEYTLYPVTNGNFTETIISENEFKD